MQFEPHQVILFTEPFAKLEFDAGAKRSVHLQASAFIWSDEAPNFHSDKAFPVPISRFFLALLSFRHTLMLGVPHRPFEPYWQAFVECCPSWPGFCPERYSPSLISEFEQDFPVALARLERMLKLCQQKQKPLPLSCL